MKILSFVAPDAAGSIDYISITYLLFRPIRRRFVSAGATQDLGDRASRTTIALTVRFDLHTRILSH